VTGLLDRLKIVDDWTNCGGAQRGDGADAIVEQKLRGVGIERCVNLGVGG
jgi:hypothetical protein